MQMKSVTLVKVQISSKPVVKSSKSLFQVLSNHLRPGTIKKGVKHGNIGRMSDKISHRKQFGGQKQAKNWLGVGYSIGYENFFNKKRIQNFF